jgi:hypothetical protein
VQGAALQPRGAPHGPSFGGPLSRTQTFVNIKHKRLSHLRPLSPLPCAVYRAGEDYVCDSVDQMERELTALVATIQSKGKLRKAGAGAGASSSSSGPTDTALHEEIAQGMDRLWSLLLAPYEYAGDMFEVYSLKNLFAWPAGVPMQGGAGGGASGRVYTAGQEKDADARIAKLEAAIRKVRERKGGVGVGM